MNNVTQPLIFWITFFIFIGLTAVYFYLFNSSILQAVRLQQLNEVLNKRQSEVLVLERDYLLRSNQITLEMAYALGFRDASQTALFVKAGETPLTFARR